MSAPTNMDIDKDTGNKRASVLFVAITRRSSKIVLPIV